jgi:hypothetical protein
MVQVEWALVVMTGGLLVATLVLGLFTRTLASATNQLVKIEKRREQAERVRAKRERLERKLSLAEEVVNTRAETLLTSLSHGNLPEPEASILRQLAMIIEYGRDQVLESDIKRLLLAFDNVSRGRAIQDASWQEFVETFNRVREGLGRDLFRWREELLTLSGKDHTPAITNRIGLKEPRNERS